MSDVDMAAVLRVSIQAAGPGWAAQPSRLRLSINESLGSNAPRYRSEVHQIIVAAEERVPSRLAGVPAADASQLDDLASDLAATRGWNLDAATRAVTTWAEAMGLDGAGGVGGVKSVADLRDIASQRPDVSPVPTVLPAAAPTPTVRPGVAPAPTPTVLPLPQDRGVGDFTVLPSASPGDGPAPVASLLERVPTAELPRTATKTPTRRAAGVLEREIEIAFSVRTGPGPAVMVPVILVGVAATLFAGPLGSVVWIVCAVALIGLSLASPFRVLALAGDEVWLLAPRNPLSTRPSSVIHHGTRDDIRPEGGVVLPVVSFGGQRLRFYLPTTKAGRLLTRGSSPRHGEESVDE